MTERDDEISARYEMERAEVGVSPVKTPRSIQKANPGCKPTEGRRGVAKTRSHDRQKTITKKQKKDVISHLPPNS